MNSLELSLIVFAITLVITKSRLLACKRDFVEKRYQASKLNVYTPWIIKWIHRIWHAIMTCPMCSGAWVSFWVCSIFTVHGYIVDVAISFSLNWLWHCLENVLFVAGEYFDLSKNIPEESRTNSDG